MLWFIMYQIHLCILFYFQKFTGDFIMNSCLNAMELTTTINTLSVAVSECLDDDNLVLAAAIFTQIGDTLATIAVQRDICKKKCNE